MKILKRILKVLLLLFIIIVVGYFVYTAVKL